jgi:hypothetical protein
MDVQDEMLEGPRIQNRIKEPRHKTAAVGEKLDSVEGSVSSRAIKQGLGIAEGSALSRTEEEPNSTTGIASVRRKKKKDLWMMVRTWTKWNLIREPLGISRP